MLDSLWLLGHVHARCATHSGPHRFTRSLHAQ